MPLYRANCMQVGCSRPSLVGQPLHKREAGSGVMPICELFQCLCNTCGVQNHAHEDLAPGWSEHMEGTTSTIYQTRKTGT